MQFADAKYMTAKDKELTLRAWKTFIKGIAEGIRGERLLKRFNKRIYNHLSLHCSFIAHYNSHGFFMEYFANPASMMRFISQFDSDYGFKSIEYGDTHWYDSQDINKAMCKVVNEYREVIYKDCSSKVKNQELNKARSLAKKYGFILRRK